MLLVSKDRQGNLVTLVLEGNLVPREHQAWMETKEYLATEENL